MKISRELVSAAQPVETLLVAQQPSGNPTFAVESKVSSDVKREEEKPLYEAEKLQDLYSIPNDTKLLGIEKKTWLIGSVVAVLVLITVGFVAYKKAK